MAVKKHRRNCMPLIVVGIIALALFGSLVYATMNADSLGISPRGKVADALGISLEEADNILDIFASCGIRNIKEIVHDDLLDGMTSDGETGYRVSTNEVNNVILYVNENKNVNSIRYADQNLYIDGTTVAKLYHDLVVGIE